MILEIKWIYNIYSSLKPYITSSLLTIKYPVIELNNAMPKLVVFSTTPIEHNLEEGSTSIGRGKANDIILEEKSVSKRHAIITCQTMKDGDIKVQIADLHSTNGTLVNGNKISYHTLEDSDQLSIGSVQCAYLID
jgi:hypothetical protein